METTVEDKQAEVMTETGSSKTTGDERYYQRFDGYSRFLHVLVILSLLCLALTGMTIKFSG